MSHKHANELQILPHHLEQIVKVPLVMCGNGHGVGHLVDDVQLLCKVMSSTCNLQKEPRVCSMFSNLNGDLVDLVEHIEAREVHTVALNHIDELVCRGVAPERHIRIVDLVLA